MDDSIIDGDKTNNSTEGKGMREKLLNLTKSVVVTGIVIWSVPLVGPSLVVCSLLGAVFFVPFSFLYASSAVAENILKKLLPFSVNGEQSRVLEQQDGELVYGVEGDEFVKLDDKLMEEPGERRIPVNEESLLEIDVTKVVSPISEEEHTADVETYNLSGQGSSTPLRPAIEGVRDSNSVELQVPELEEDGTILQKNVTVISQEKLKEQIDALCKIIGYESEPSATCGEELRALYVSIGVEPPTGMVTCGVEELHSKLHLLMSIIGVQ